MKKLSDYKGEDAILLWADLLEPLTDILTDDGVREVITKGQSKLEIAKVILKNQPKAAADLLLAIDSTPLDGLNIVLRLAAVITDIGQNEEIKSFFGYAEQAETEKESGGLPTESTGAKGK